MVHGRSRVQQSAGVNWWRKLTRCTAVSAFSVAMLAGATSAAQATAPSLQMVTPVATPGNNNTPALTFSSDEAGTITYGGSCSSATTAATAGNNAITLNTLAEGTYSDCTITVTDSSANASTPLAIPAFTIDTVAPTLTVSIQSSNTNNTLAKLHETVTLIIVADEELGIPPAVTMGGQGAVIYDTASNKQNYFAQIDVGAAVPDGVLPFVISGVQDAAGNTVANLIATTDGSSVTVDQTAPQMVGPALRFNPTAQDTNADTLVYRVHFNEAVTGANTTSFNVFGRSTASVTQVQSVDGGTTLDVTVSGGDLANYNGSLTLVGGDLSTIKDAAGNALQSSKGAQGYLLDNTAPTATVAAPVNANAPFDVTVSFNDHVSGFDPLNLNVVGGAVDEATWTTRAGTSFSGKVIATGNLVNIILPQGSAADAAGNGNTASNTVMVQFDNTAPVIWVSPEVAALGNDNTPTFTLTSNEAGTLTYGGACSSATTDMPAGPLSIRLNPLADGTYSNCTVQVTDALGNASNILTLTEFTIDTVAPTLTSISPDEGTTSPTDVDTIGFTMRFSEAVNTFDASQFNVMGTSATGVVTGADQFRDIRLSGGDLADLNGTVTVSLRSVAVITDLAGNAMTTAVPTGTNNNSVQIINDADAPVLEFVNIQSNSALGNDKAVQGDTITLIIRANEPLAGEPRVTVLGQSAFVNPVFLDTVSVSAEDTEYVGVFFVPFIDGRDQTVTFTIDNFSDTAGNAGASVSATTDGSSVRIDGVRPTGVTTANVTGPLLSSAPESFTLTVTFSEPVTGFVGAENITANGVALSDMVAVTDRVYTFTATPDGRRDVYIELNSNGIADGFGNGLESPEPLQIEVTDDIAPAVTISTNTNTFTQSALEERMIAVQFSEFVVAPDKSTLSIVNGEALSLVALDELDSVNFERRIDVTSAAYLLTVKPDGTGDVTVQVPAGITTDSTGNANAASEPLVLTMIDDIAPTVVVTTSADTFNQSSSTPFTVTYTISEDVNPVGDPIAAVQAGIANGVPSNFQIVVPHTVFSATVTPNGNADVTISLLAGTVIDGEDNLNAASDAVVVRRVDDIKPFAFLNAEVMTFSKSGLEEREVTLSFNEHVVQPSKDAIQVQNGTATAIRAGFPGGVTANDNAVDVDDFFYTLTIKPDGVGDVSVSVPAGITTDASGNANAASGPLILTMQDDIAPTVAITLSANDFKLSTLDAITATYTFSKDVTFVGDALASLNASLTNATASNLQTLTANTVFTATITPDGKGDVSVGLAADAAIDVSENKSLAAAPVVARLVDDVGPGAELAADITTFTKSGLEERQLRLTFTEPVVKPRLGAIQIENGTVLSVETNAGQVRAAAEADVAVDGDSYTLTIKPDGAGDVSVTVLAGITTDANRNANSASTPLVLTMVDDTIPSVAITLSVESMSLSALQPFTATYTFSKPVTFVGDGLASVNAGLVNATASDLTPQTSATVFTATITPDGNGDVSVSLAEGAAKDASGQPSPASDNVVMRVLDDLAPEGFITGVPQSTNGSTAFDITMTFNEPVAGLTSDDFGLANAAVSDLVAVAATAISSEFVGSATWTATITPDGGGDVSVDIAANAVEDESKNTNPSKIGPYVALLDSTDPTLISITREGAETTDADVLSWIFEFSEPVTGFGPDDVNLTGQSGDVTITVQPLGNGDDNSTSARIAQRISVSHAFAPSSNASKLYRVTASGGDITDGNFTLSVGIAETAAIADANGNAMTTFEPTEIDEGTTIIINDSESPTVVISAPAAAVGPFDVTFEFSEPVTGFTASDLTIANATISEPRARSLRATQGFGQAVASSSDFAQSYIAIVTPSEHGDVTIALAGNAVLDEAGNTNVASETVIVAFTDASLVQARTGAVINNFVYRRAQNILATQPNLSGRLDDRGGLGMTEKFAFSAEGDGDGLQIDFGGSLTRLMSGKALAYADEGITGGSTDATELSRFNVWASGSLTQSSIGGEVQDFGVIHLGADYRVNQAFLVGAMGQYDYAEEFDPTTGIGASGKGWLIGPYTVIRLHDRLIFDGRALWGRSSNSVTPFGTYKDDFDTERFLVKGQLTGEFDMSGWTISPILSLAYLKETQEAYVSEANVPIAERTVEIGQLSFGPTISQTFLFENGARITPRFSLEGIWNFKDTGIANIDTGILEGGHRNNLRARADIGVKTEFGIGATLDVSGFVEGIADNDNQIYGGTAKLNIPF